MDDRKPALDAKPASDVLILGAGFSRAVSAALPLTDELGQLAVAGLPGTPAVPADFGQGDFEVWLSRIAEDQPHLSEAENRANQAVFARVTEELMKVLAERQGEALAAQAPPWLYELVGVLHVLRPTVLTLNYDTLVEAAVAGHQLWDFSAEPEPEPPSPLPAPYFARPRGRRVGPGDVLDNIPSVRIGSASATWADLNGSVADTFRLLKLHGSLNWYWVPGDLTGSTLNRTAQRAGFGAPPEDDTAARRRELPGRDPFIVPPLATKTAYYRNPITREIWRRASEALRSASAVDLIGYSLPPADLVMAGLLEDASRGRPLAWEVVNLRPEDPVGRLRRMGVDGPSIRVIDGPDCVRRFVSEYVGRASTRLVAQLRAAALPAGETPLLVGWAHPNAPSPAYRVKRVMAADAGGEVELQLETPPPGGPTAARFDAGGQPSGEPFATLGDLLTLLGDKRAERLVARTTGGERWTLVTTLRVATDYGAAAAWLALVPAQRPS